MRYIPTIGFKSYALEYGTGIDADGDGTLDRVDAFPDDSTETVDTDSDGFGDNSDEHNGQDDTVINNSLGLTSGDNKINLSAWLASNNYAVDDGGPSLADHNVVVDARDAALAAQSAAESALITAQGNLTTAQNVLATVQSDLTAKQAELDNAKEARPGSIAIDVTDAVIEGVTKQVANITLTVEETTAVSCLLYTSPSPRDGLLSRMPSSA